MSPEPEPQEQQTETPRFNESEVREQLREVVARLREVEDERDILRNLVKGYEGLLRMHAQPSVRKRRA